MERRNSVVQMLTRSISVLAVCAYCAPLSHAYSECEYKLETLLMSLQSTETVWAKITNAQGVDKGAIYKNLNNASQSVLDRLHAHLLSAYLSDHHIIVRFPEHGVDCSSDQGARGDFESVWIKRP